MITWENLFGLAYILLSWKVWNKLNQRYFGIVHMIQNIVKKDQPLNLVQYLDESNPEMEYP
jgi:hypothetical protein